MKGALNIEILGTSFSIQSENEDSMYLEKLLTHYRKVVRNIEVGGDLKDPLKTAILAGILLCDEVFGASKKFEKSLSEDELKEFEASTLRMLNLLDKV